MAKSTKVDSESTGNSGIYMILLDFLNAEVEIKIKEQIGKIQKDLDS